ncbi:DUF4123 domain-containing protein [Vreelandella stevensii]|uniref:DUF4123 domain-containing protein n=1 Tax=Vreelandella stevensii TaxID=502821 RepID=UPI00403AC01C
MKRALPSCTHLVLDTAQPNIREQWYRRSAYSAEGELLYTSTPFAHLADVSPIVARTSADDPFLHWVLTQRPGLRWGILLESYACSRKLLNHFQHWLTIFDDQGNEVLWRFYDPMVLPYFLDAFGEQERQQWFGPCQAVHCLTQEGVISQRADKQENAALEDVTSQPLPAAPWWRINKRHLVLLRPMLRNELIVEAHQRLLMAAWSWLMHLETSTINARLGEVIDRLTVLNQGVLPSVDMAEHFCLLVFTSCSHLEQREDFKKAIATHGIAKTLTQWQAYAYGRLPDRAHHDIQWLPDGPYMSISEEKGARR